MKISKWVVAGVVGAVLAVIIVVVVATRSELSEVRKVLYVANKREARKARQEEQTKKVSSFLTPIADTTGTSGTSALVTDVVPRTEDGIVPWSAAINVYDQFSGGYRAIGTASAQASDNDSTFILLAKPADSRYNRFWYRLKCAVSDRFCDIYLPNKDERKNTGDVITVSELPNDSPLVLSITESWYLYS